MRQEIVDTLKSLKEDAPLIKKYLSIELLPEKNTFVSFKDLNEHAVSVLENLNKKYQKIKEIEKIEKELNTNDSKLVTLLDTKIYSFTYKKYTDFKDFDSLNKYYLSIYDNITNVINNFDSYENFHHWRHYLSDNKTETEINIINALKEIPTENWKNVFMAWYFKKSLLNFDSKSTVGFNKSDAKLVELSVVYNKLKEKQIQQIKSKWNTKRRLRLSSYPGNFNTLYNLRKNNSGPKNSLRKIIEKDFDLFTSLFPIILTNPSAANAILPLKQGLFNVIIFDEASQLRISDTFACLIRGQYKIIAGDEHQMPPSNYFLSSNNTFEEAHDEFEEYDNEQDELADSESLLQYASNLRDINKSSLDYHYRSNHPALIEFSNAAFYGGNLVSFPALSEYTPIKFIPVNGRYESNTNPTEVAEIIRIIKDEIQLNTNNKYPSVGIATFNINQRNLIIESLNKVAESDSDFLTKYLALKESGLFIKNLENIQGDEKDIIIISTTYGYGVDGKFSQNFARINRIEGYKLLNVLITRAKNKVYVCTSIPKEKYVSYPELIKGEGGNNKRGILYAYLAYAEAISNKDSVLAEGILSELKLQSFEKPKLIFDDDGLSESPFEEEVYELLLDKFKKEDVVQQHKVGGFRLDFVIKYNGHNYVLECDGKSYHQSEEAYAYDMYRQKELEHMGYVVYRIWSTNWFQNKELEMTKFMDFINKPKVTA